MNVIDKIIMGLKSIYLSFLYTIYNLFLNENRFEETNEVHVVVSLTCFPGRIKKVYLTLESIMAQQYNNFKVVLYLSHEEFPKGLEDLPGSLIRLHKRGVDINFTCENIRSYKKLHYALSDFPELPVITADDDVLYPSRWVNDFMESHKLFHDDILFARGHQITFDRNGNVKKYISFGKPAGYSASSLYIPTGVSGILYPPGCFFQDVQNKDIFMKLAPNADDIWYKVMTLLNGRKSRLIYKKPIHYPPILGTQKISLRKQNLSKQHLNNDTQLLNLIDYYSIELADFKKKE